MILRLMLALPAALFMLTACAVSLVKLQDGAGRQLWH